MKKKIAVFLSVLVSLFSFQGTFTLAAEDAKSTDAVPGFTCYAVSSISIYPDPFLQGKANSNCTDKSGLGFKLKEIHAQSNLYRKTSTGLVGVAASLPVINYNSLAVNAFTGTSSPVSGATYRHEGNHYYEKDNNTYASLETSYERVYR